MTDNPNQPSGREKFNRLLGLSSYAGGIVLLGILIWVGIETLSTRGMTGLKKDLSSIAILGGMAVVMFAIGYTTGRPRSKG
jgi:hypothetical protein